MRKDFTCLALSTVIAGCGGGGGDAPLVSDPPPVVTAPTITTQAVFANLSFTRPVALMQAPGDSTRWFVVEKGGVVRVFANDQNVASASVFLDISNLVNASGEGGLLGLAFHPNFPVTPEAFVSYTRSGTPLVSYVSRFFSADSGQTLNAATEEVIITVDQPATNHNGGNVAFGPDGFLYVGFGDGGGSGDPNGNGQDTRTLMGAIVRLDVEGGSPYGIPAGNPFEANAVCIGGTGVDDCPEIYAWGLRNPWRFSFDTVTSKLWVGDVGQSDWEEIDVITAGGNYGWNVREGAHCFNPSSGCANTFIEPVSEYDHGLGGSVTGGLVYRGTAIPELAGWYLFGDFTSGRLFGIREDSAVGIEPEVLNETGLQIVSFGQDANGEIYVLNFIGNIHQIVDAP
jgi:glucose/arabinose dehydrogenase